jgi:excisionase family DNA binding protein
MKRRRASARRVKIHLNYTVDEAAETIGAHKNTVRRWIATGQLPALTETRPHLILGRELHRFLTARKSKAVTLKPGECYCVKCKAAKQPGLGMADFEPVNDRWGNLQGLCPDCGILMHRRASRAQLDQIAGNLDVTILVAQPRLSERAIPSTNVDFKEV